MESALINNKKVYAFELEKAEGAICSCCHEPVVFKNGLIKRAHFAHKTNSKCLLSENESEEHVQIKNEIFNNLKKFKFIENLEMEKFHGNCISDIYFEKNNKKFAIEIQLSKQTREQMIERFDKYTKKNIYVLWIHSYDLFLKRIDLKSKTLSIHDWEKFIYGMNFGNIYLWRNDSVIPVKLEKIKKSNGSYYKGYRKATSLEEKNIAMDFFGVEKNAFEGLPKATIMKFKS